MEVDQKKPDTRIGARPEKTVEGFRQGLIEHLYYTRGQEPHFASALDAYMTLCHTVRDYLVRRWRGTVEAHFEANPKIVYYLSAEYLLGRQLQKNLMYTETRELAREALAEDERDLEDYIEMDVEPGLGNGGLGRLAACFLDSMATLDIPCIGYGIRYEFGIFKQAFEDGWQVESPDEWLQYGNPWEFPQPDDMVEVQFGGHTEGYMGSDGEYHVRWISDQRIRGEPYHMMVPGYGTGTVNMLRLWRARASKEFDFKLFDAGDYVRAVEQKTNSENISKVLYPNDNTFQGKELRLRQQYFFVACSLQDIIRIFRARNEDWERFPDKVVIQLNDTHPVVAIPELMRLLMDEYGLGWKPAWDITRKTFAYTNHTLLPEALEQWSVHLFARLLPRHYEIIEEINRRFLDEVRRRYPNDPNRITRMSIIADGYDPRVRMAYLACVGSFSINGVAELQSRLLQERVLRDFYDLWPERFNNKTNGVTPRRFIGLANPELSDLITEKIGDGWLKDLNQLSGLEAHIDDPEFRATWRRVKQQKKAQLATYIRREMGMPVDPNALFDVMVKRLHEYKRQLLKVLHIVTLYNRIKADPGLKVVPRVFVFGAKAAPGYHMAKLIIKLINSVGDVVNADPDVAGRLRVVFMPNFNVTLAQRIYPAADLSEQISMAGKEASGTGNMKFALNGALTIGTLDGANIEIRERVGEDNFFLFGLKTEEVFALKKKGYDPKAYIQRNPELQLALDRISDGHFSKGDTQLFRPIIDSLIYHDEYLLLADYASYIDAQKRVERMYGDQETWTRMSILNAARCGFFSSDRTIRQYSEDIWQVEPVPVEVD